MTFFRRILGRATLACLLCQLATSVVVPAIVLASESGGVECTCSHGDHAFCPMHHPRPTSHGRCAMRGTPDPAAVLVQALIGCTGATPSSETAPAPLVSQVEFFPATSLVIPHDLQPDAPPPRG